MNRSTLAIVVIAVLGAAAGYWFGSNWRQSPDAAIDGVTVVRVGELVPELRLPQPDGTERSLGDFRGRPLLINYWASWCEPCVKELPVLNAFAHEQHPAGVAVLGIAQDAPRSVARFLRKIPVDYPILIEAPGSEDSAARLGNSRNVLPFSALLDSNGRLLAHRVGTFDAASLRDWVGQHVPN